MTSDDKNNQKKKSPRELELDLVKEEKKDIFVERFKKLVKDKKENEDIKTDKEISLGIGITEQSFNNYCNRLPDIIQLIKIAKYFKVSLEYLVGESNNKHYIDYSLGNEFGLDDEAINNLRSLAKSRNESNTKETNKGYIKLFAINKLLGQNYMTLVEKIGDYLTFPSKENTFISNTSSNFIINDKTVSKYDEANTVYLYHILKHLEALSTDVKKSEEVASIFEAQSSEILTELQNWDGD